MKIYETQLDPITNTKLQIKLYRNVKNIPDLRQKIITGQLQCCIIKATLIVDPFQIVVAANKAVIAQKQNRLITRSVFSEILFNLSITRNVTKSLIQFGIDDKIPDIIVAVLLEDDRKNEIFEAIDGDERNIDDLKDITDLRAVKKAYNLSNDEEKHLLDCIVNKIVIKDF